MRRFSLTVFLCLVCSCSGEWKGKGKDYQPYGGECNASFETIASRLDSFENTMRHRGLTFTPRPEGGFVVVGTDRSSNLTDLQDYLLWSDLVRKHQDQPRAAEFQAKREALLARTDLITYQAKGWEACQ